MTSAALPKKLWDRTTGSIDPEVARAWEAYDIRLKLERNWQSLAPQLRGKLHVATGELDTFYLEGAVERLAESLRQLGSDAEIEVLPGRDHGGVLSGERLAKIRRQMSEAYLQHHKSSGCGAPSRSGSVPTRICVGWDSVPTGFGNGAPTCEDARGSQMAPCRYISK